MDDAYMSDSGSTSGERETSADSDHAESMKLNMSNLESNTKDFQKVLKERDHLEEDVFRLEARVEELTAEKGRLSSEHAEELLILSSSFSEHFAKSGEDSQDSIDSRQSLKECDKEVQKLRGTIEDKNYHINKLQQKVLEAQFEMEEELEKHENEVDSLRSELEKAEGNGENDFERLLEERLQVIKTKYEGEIEQLKAELENSENVRESDRTSNGVYVGSLSQEIEELKLKLQKLQENKTDNVENWIKGRLEEEDAKELLVANDRVSPKHQLDVDNLLSQLELAKGEVERLKEALHEKEISGSQKGGGQGRTSNGQVEAEDVHNLETNGPLGNGDSTLENQDSIAAEVMEEVKADIHGRYQQQMEQIVKKLQDDYQADLDESLSKVEEDWEQQFDRQRTEYEQKMAAHQRQLRAQHQADISQVTSHMEDQIQALKDGHSEEIAELMGRIRECSEERRLSVMQQDTSQQEVIIITEEYRSKVEGLENELRAEKDKSEEYQQQMEAVEAQVQAFKAEKEEEVRMIEEELRKQCKLLVEKKNKEMKERYQSELNEKLNKVEQHLRREYEEDICKTKSELEESNRTLKEKYEREVSDIMVQMEDVQQRNKEVLLQEQKQFEEEQKQQFQKQLSEVMEELEPYKAKCSALEKENNQLTQKYKKDLSELKNKLDEVEVRYKGNEAMDGKQLEMLREELDLYKNKIRELEEGNTSLMKNYEAQLVNMRKNYEEENDAEFKTLQGEVKIYTKKVEVLEEEKRVSREKFEAEVSSLKEMVEKLESDVKNQTAETESKNQLNEELASRIEELTSSLESYKNSYTALVNSKNDLDNKYTVELEDLRAKTEELEKLLRSSREGCIELEKQKRLAEENGNSEIERLKHQLEEERSVTLSKAEDLQKILKDNEGTEKELSRVTGELGVSNNKCAELEAERLIKDNKHMEELETMREKMKELQKQASENRDVVLQNTELVQRITELERKLKESQEHIAELEQIRKALDNKHAEEMATSTGAGDASVDKTEAEMLQLERDLEESKKTISELERANAEYSQEITTLLVEVERLKSSQEEGEDDPSEYAKQFEEEIESLKALVEEQTLTITELENEGENKFGVLMSQHEKELEALKEELEEQIAKKREQLAKETAWKRQKLKEEYENKLRVIYDELVSEKHKTRDQYRVNENLQQQLNSLEEDNERQLKEISRVKQLEETLKQVEEEMTRRNSEAERQNIAKDQDKVRGLEAEIKALRELNLNLSQTAEEGEEGADKVNVLREKIASLENELETEKAEVKSLGKKLRELTEKDGNNVEALTESYESQLRKTEQEVERLSSKLEGNKKDYELNLQSMEETKDELSKTLQVAQNEKEKLEKTVSQLDTAKQAVVQMYDEKIELLAQDLDDANERASLSDEKLNEMELSFTAKEAELSNGLSQLRLEKDELVEENKIVCRSLEEELTKEKESKYLLQQKLDELEGMFNERARVEESDEGARAENKSLIDEYKERVKNLETELRDEKMEMEKLREFVEGKQEELSRSETKLKEINELVSGKEHAINEYGVRVKELVEQLDNEKGKTSRLEKELQGVLESQSSDYVQNLERIKSDLKEEYEETTQTLKKNYESLFTKREDEYRTTCDEMEAEMQTLRGMVENLEELNRLKDEEQEALMREQTDNHETEVKELREKYTEEKEGFLVRIDNAEKKVVEVVNEKEELAADHVAQMKDLESRLSSEHRDEVERWSRQAKDFDQEKNELKGKYDTEIELLNEQLVFETTFQGNLQSEHQRELAEQKETLENARNKEVNEIKHEFQEKIRLLESEKSQREREVNELTAKLDECNKEFETLTQSLTSKQEAELNILEERLHEKAQECEKLETLLKGGGQQGEREHGEKFREKFQEKVQECEVLKDQLRKLTTSVEALMNEKSSSEKDESERMKTEFDAKLSVLQVENDDLRDCVRKLESELEDRNLSHQQEIDFIKAEVERQFSQREDQITKRHSEELGVLMEKLEHLVQQESASKTLTEEHMQDLVTLKKEFDERFERLLKEKQQEVAQTKTLVENQFRETVEELQDQLRRKSRETQRLQESMDSLQIQVQEIEDKNQEHLKALDRASDELIKLREENADLFRRNTKSSSRSRASSDTKVLSENERLKREIQNLKNLLQNGAVPSRRTSDTSLASEGTRVIQLVKLMEQLMKEKNLLELKLRQEIIDLKTRFIGDASRTSLENSSLSLASPVRGIKKDSLVDTLHELRDNQQKQEEDIKEHLQDIENMIEEIKKRMDSVEFTDARIQDVLASQLKHLQEQRRLVIHRLWQLKEKHKLLEQKITRQIAELSAQNSPNSSMDSARSKLYESIVEENLRREKELLTLKRKQADHLQGRLESEKRALERHTAETKKLERELKEKDRLERELSSERSELEKKYRGKVKERELELTQKAFLVFRSDQGVRDEMPLRSSQAVDKRERRGRQELFEVNALPTAPPSLDRKRDEHVRDVDPKSRHSSERRQYQPLQDAVERIRQRRNKENGNYAARNGRGSENSTSFGSNKSRNSSSSTAYSPQTSNTRRAEETESTSIPTLDLSSDESDIELDLPDTQEMLQWEMELGDDSDIELYTPDSLAEPEDLEQDWEMTLEKELKQVSEGVLLVPSRDQRKCTRAAHDRHSNGPGSTKSNTDFVERTTTGMMESPVLSSSGSLLEGQNLNHRQKWHPRTSTAVTDEEEQICFGEIDLSQISSLSRASRKGARSEIKSNEEEKRERHGDTVPKQRQLRKTNAVQEKTNNGFAGEESTRSTRSKSARKRSSLYQEYKLRHMRTGAVYLLNVDDYVDRHLVKSSEDVARIRDLSPAEKRFMSKQDSPLE